MWCKKLTLILLFLLIIVLLKTEPRVFALDIQDNSSVCSDPSKEKECQEWIKSLENKVLELQGQEKTLSSQISIMNNQIRLTQSKIDATKQKIISLEQDIEIAKDKISGLENDLNYSTKALLGRIGAVYKVGAVDPWQMFLTSDSISNFFTRLKYLRIVQIYDKKNIYAAEQAKVNYANQQEILEDKQDEEEALKITLESYTEQLDNEKKSKAVLLDATRNDEKKYQELLAKTRSEFEAIQGIMAGKGDEVEVGQVEEGAKIASIIQGYSCNSNGSHLHFTIADSNGNTQNPFNFLKGGVDYKNCSGSSCGSADSDPFNPSGSWNWPISGPISFSQGYGNTWATKYTWVRQIYNFHNGIDINSSSSDIKAVQSGTLFRGSYTGYNGCRLRYVRVKHQENNLETYYLHVNYY
ncbi:hypothetical protein C4577_05250 [Candidatus Parcubacteria bacterium]|nr:MAG: hypothetical protein C4577_05250 [Candidatus Parcubacteria bacterium]